MDLKVKAKLSRTSLEGNSEGYDFLFSFDHLEGHSPDTVEINVTKENVMKVTGHFYKDSKQYGLNLYDIKDDDLKVLTMIYDKVNQIVSEAQ